MQERMTPKIPQLCNLGLVLGVGRHCGQVVRALVTGAECPEFKTQLVLGIFQKLSRFIRQ